MGLIRHLVLYDRSGAQRICALVRITGGFARILTRLDDVSSARSHTREKRRGNSALESSLVSFSPLALPLEFVEVQLGLLFQQDHPAFGRQPHFLHFKRFL